MLSCLNDIMDEVIRSIHQSKIEEILRHINLIHPNLKFTTEMELNGRISFLDMLLIRIVRKLFSTWYCKPTDTGLVMNFHALAPKRYKRSVVSGFVHRIYCACSSWQYFCDSIEKLRKFLKRTNTHLSSTSQSSQRQSTNSGSLHSLSRISQPMLLTRNKNTEYYYSIVVNQPTSS